MGRPRAVIVTDADQGIGRATALHLAEVGLWVLACGEDREAMADMPRETNQGGLVHLHLAPLDGEEGCRRVLDRIQTLYGGLDAIVYTAGLAQFGPFEEMEEPTLRRILEMNFFGPARLIHLATPILREQRKGRVVCVASAAGRVALPMSAAYSASQYALEGLCDALRLELGIFGIDVVLIEPGLVRAGVVTEAKAPPSAQQLFGVTGASPYRAIAEVLRETVAEMRHRAATPQDVAEVIEKALTTSRPKARYAVSRATAALLWARKLLPDRFLDSRLAKAMGLSELE